MKHQLTFAVAQFSANPNAGKIVALVLFVSVTVIGLVVPGVAALAGPISGEAG
jgi:hypothetical protein